MHLTIHYSTRKDISYNFESNFVLVVNERFEYALHRALGCLEVLGRSMGVRAIGNEDLR